MSRRSSSRRFETRKNVVVSRDHHENSSSAGHSHTWSHPSCQSTFLSRCPSASAFANCARLPNNNCWTIACRCGNRTGGKPTRPDAGTIPMDRTQAHVHPLSADGQTVNHARSNPLQAVCRLAVETLSISRHPLHRHTPRRLGDGATLGVSRHSPGSPPRSELIQRLMRSPNPFQTGFVSKILLHQIWTMGLHVRCPIDIVRHGRDVMKSTSTYS